MSDNDDADGTTGLDTGEVGDSQYRTIDLCLFMDYNFIVIAKPKVKPKKLCGRICFLV